MCWQKAFAIQIRSSFIGLFFSFESKWFIPAQVKKLFLAPLSFCLVLHCRVQSWIPCKFKVEWLVRKQLKSECKRINLNLFASFILRFYLLPGIQIIIFTTSGCRIDTEKNIHHNIVFLGSRKDSAKWVIFDEENFRENSLLVSKSFFVEKKSLQHPDKTQIIEILFKSHNFFLWNLRHFKKKFQSFFLFCTKIFTMLTV